MRTLAEKFLGTGIALGAGGAVMFVAVADVVFVVVAVVFVLLGVPVVVVANPSYHLSQFRAKCCFL